MKRLIGIMILAGFLTIWQAGICAAYTVTSPFGMRIHPIHGTWQFQSS